MEKRVKRLVMILLLGWMWPLVGVQAGPLIDFDAKPAALESYAGKGKWLVVMIWASDCLICNKEAKEYERFHQQHQNRDATVLGITMDGRANRAAAEAFIKEHKLNFTNLLGEPEDVATMFYDLTGENWAGTPTFLIYSPAGKLTVQQIGAVPVSMIEEFIQKQAPATSAKS